MERLPSDGVSVVENRVSFGVELGVGDGVGRSADVEVLAPLTGDPGVRRAGDEPADDGRDPEGPELPDRAVAVEEGDGGGAGRIDRGVADRDGDEVGDEEAEPDS